MSRNRALAALHLERTDLVPQIEFLEQPEFVKKVSGLDPAGAPEQALAETYRRLDLDMIWHAETPELVDAGRDESDFAKTEWAWSGSTWRIGSRFTTVEDVLAFRPLEALPRWDRDAEVERRRREVTLRQAIYGDSILVPGGYYTTLFTWGIMTFGWQLFMEAAAGEPDRFEPILQQFAEISTRDVLAWSEVGVDAFISHDDIAMSRGPIFSPQWMRQHIFPRYAEIWRPLRAKGIPVIFCSDGNFTPLIDDIAAAGADGFILEPYNDIEYIVERYGRSKAIVGHLDARILTLGEPADVKAEVWRGAALAERCPGYFFNVTNHIPHNVPLHNVEAYFEACKHCRLRA